MFMEMSSVNRGKITSTNSKHPTPKPAQQIPIQRNARNKAARTRLRSAVKRVRQAGAKTEGSEALQQAFSIIDKSAKKGLIHRNNAANQKAKLSRAVAKLSG